jgi:hypothetical protein
MTDLEPKKVRDLDLYVRPLEGETMEVLVFDNELPIYHTTVADVALRKSPVWKEIFSIKNIKKVMDDKDVIVSKGKESLNRLYDDALARLDLSYNGDDLALLVEDARRGLEQKSLEQIQESFDLFFTLLHFQPVSLGILQDDIEVFAKGTISPQSDLDLAWVLQYAQGEETPDLQGVEVFEFLAALALKEKP